MEIFTTIISFLILGLIIIAPIILLVILKRLKVSKVLIFYSLIGLILLGLLMLVFAWWGHNSNLILLEHYGYNMDGWNDIEQYGSVSPENLERVKVLEISVLGIGWPLKAMFGFVTFIPYLIVVYIAKVLFEKFKKNKDKL